jgi:LysM repeat protein
MVHNFNQFLTHRSLLESQILERAEGDFFPEENIGISIDDIKVPMRPPDKSSSSDKSGTVRATQTEIPADVVEYTVRSGDTLAKIALSLGMKATDWKKIYTPNASVIGPDPNKIRVGMKLKVPKGSSPSTSTPSPTSSKTDKEQDKKIKVVQISNQTDPDYIKKLKEVKSSIDSSGSKVLFDVNKPLGCATFVNGFTKAVEYVNDAWKARDTIEGTVIYDVFKGLDKDQIATCINLWNEIYQRKPALVLDGTNSKNVKWRLGQKEGKEIRNLIINLLEKNPLDAKKLKIGDICGIFYPASIRQEQAFYEAGKNYFTDANGNKGRGNVPGRTIAEGKSWAMNSHVGIVGAIENGNPVIFHAIPKYGGLAVDIWADGVDKIHGGGKIVWVKRPKTSQSVIEL